MSPWIVGPICLVAGGLLGVIVMACCCAARDADRRAETDDLKIRVRWTCPACGLEQAGLIPAIQIGGVAMQLITTTVTCSEFIGGCGRQFVVGSRVVPRVTVEEDAPHKVQPSEPWPPPPPTVESESNESSEDSGSDRVNVFIPWTCPDCGRERANQVSFTLTDGCLDTDAEPILVECAKGWLGGCGQRFVLEAEIASTVNGLYRLEKCLPTSTDGKPNQPQPS
jgi:rubredoxin